MTLAAMWKADADALRCDLAETYHIYDLEALPVKTVALLACGLRANSRIIMKITGAKVPDYIHLLAIAADQLTNLVWMQTRDGHRGRNKPRSILEQILNGNNAEHRKPAAFSSPEAFWEMRRKLIEGR